MAKYTGPKCKLCRREGTKLFLKGARCFSEKCALNKRNQPAGQHGARKPRLSDYGKHLREKQKVKRIYGILETQFVRYYYTAAKVKGVTGQVLLQMLETRLDSLLYVSGFALSRNEARQKIRQGKVKVNGKVIDIPSYQVKSNDFVEVAGMESTTREDNAMPQWLAWDTTKKGVQVLRIPAREDINPEIQEQLIVEYYSR